MSDDQFAKLFKYMEKRFNKVDKRFDEQGRKIADAHGAIAELSARVEDYHTEVVVLRHQTDRQNQATKELASATGVKLSVEL